MGTSCLSYIEVSLYCWIARRRVVVWVPKPGCFDLAWLLGLAWCDLAWLTLAFVDVSAWLDSAWLGVAWRGPAQSYLALFALI